MKKKITVISCVIFVAAMMMFAQPAISGKWADTPSGLDVEIISVAQVAATDSDVHDFDLIIYGYNFDNGAEPTVKLAGIPCVFVDGDDLGMHGDRTLFVFRVGCTWNLPVESMLINPLVTLQTGPSVHQFDTFNITLFSGP